MPMFATWLTASLDLRAQRLLLLRGASASTWGQSCSSTQWSIVADKTHKRAMDIRSTTAALPTKVPLFDIHIGGIACYRAHFAALTSHALAAYGRASQVILAAPYMALPPLLLQGMREIGFQSNLPPLEDVAAAARLRTISTSQTLHDTWREYGDMTASDGASLGAIGRLFRHTMWREHNSIPRCFRRDYIQHSGYGYVPLSPDPPSTAAIRQAGGATPDTRCEHATRVLVRCASI